MQITYLEPAFPLGVSDFLVFLKQASPDFLEAFLDPVGFTGADFLATGAARICLAFERVSIIYIYYIFFLEILAFKLELFITNSWKSEYKLLLVLFRIFNPSLFIVSINSYNTASILRPYKS
jgi:hypothetical protein